MFGYLNAKFLPLGSYMQVFTVLYVLLIFSKSHVGFQSDKKGF